MTFITKKRMFVTARLGITALVVILVGSIEVRATHVTIDANLSVSPNIISFETVFPGEVLYRPLAVELSGAFLESYLHDDVEYRILQKPKPRVDSAVERSYCEENPTDYTRCYPSLCPYLSKTPDNTPENDTEVPAFHDPNASTSIAYGRLAKSDEDTSDNWVIDLHTPCFRGECDQANSVPATYQLDPSLNGEVFGCDLVVEVTGVSYFQTPTRTIGFWQTHTSFTSNMFQTKLGGSMVVGTGSHTRAITNVSGNGKSRLFGAFYSSIPKKTNETNRNAVDKARVQLLQQLVAAKLNCAAFDCAPPAEDLILAADAAYAGTNAATMISLASQLSASNNAGDALAISDSLGPVGSATPSTSQARANKVFWDTP